MQLLRSAQHVSRSACQQASPASYQYSRHSQCQSHLLLSCRQHDDLVKFLRHTNRTPGSSRCIGQAYKMRSTDDLSSGCWDPRSQQASLYTIDVEESSTAVVRRSQADVEMAARLEDNEQGWMRISRCVQIGVLCFFLPPPPPL